MEPISLHQSLIYAVHRALSRIPYGPYVVFGDAHEAACRMADEVAEQLRRLDRVRRETPMLNEVITALDALKRPGEWVEWTYHGEVSMRSLMRGCIMGLVVDPDFGVNIEGVEYDITNARDLKRAIRAFQAERKRAEALEKKPSRRPQPAADECPF